MKEVGEALGFLGLCAEGVTLYTLAACTANGQPFPAWFRFAWAGMRVAGAAAVVGLLAALGIHLYRRTRRYRRRQRRGMVRVEGETGRIYIERR